HCCAFSYTCLITVSLHSGPDAGTFGRLSLRVMPSLQAWRTSVCELWQRCHDSASVIMEVHGGAWRCMEVHGGSSRSTCPLPLALHSWHACPLGRACALAHNLNE